jgi:hypothetical protein
MTNVCKGRPYNGRWLFCKTHHKNYVRPLTTGIAFSKLSIQRIPLVSKLMGPGKINRTRNVVELSRPTFPLRSHAAETENRSR